VAAAQALHSGTGPYHPFTDEGSGGSGGTSA